MSQFNRRSFFGFAPLAVLGVVFPGRKPRVANPETVGFKYICGKLTLPLGRVSHDHLISKAYARVLTDEELRAMSDEQLHRIVAGQRI